MADANGQNAAKTARPRASAAAEVWAIPPLTAELQQRMGSSQFDGFVDAHSPADILRELVQNEFDAGGSDMVLRFGEDNLTVTGTGRTINRKGWSRLNVFTGTGEVLGEDVREGGEVVDAKVNGIGSKNAGLRTLFRFGDRIHVRSDGRMAVLDLRTFRVAQQTDPESSGRPGAVVQIPFRTADLRRHKPFWVERENSALDDISDVLFATLVKLAIDGQKTGIRSLTIVSARTGRELRWRQQVETLKSRVNGVKVRLRSGRLRVRGPDGRQTTQTHEEIEFSRSVDIPAAHLGTDFPDYYGAGRRLRVALSLPMRGGRIAFGVPGRFYYPLQAGFARTGAAVCVSAPFQLDNERTRPIETDWNAWLQDEAAHLASDLVASDWLERFGADAYAALCPSGEPEPGSFQSRVMALLRTESCWPSQAPGEPGPAAELCIADYPALEGHIAAERYLDGRLMDNPAVVALARACGAKRFSINSLVMLRCGGKAASSLSTSLANDEANFQYAADPGARLDVDEQVRTAGALSTLQRHLSPANRLDLANTPSTLRADGQLGTAKTLVLVPADLADGCPEPLSTRLHAGLNDFRAVATHCRVFDLLKWVPDAAARAAAGQIEGPEREALYRHILASEGRFVPRTLAVLRRSPVILDADGVWSRPEALALLPKRDAGVLGRHVGAPARDVQQRTELMRRLSIRRSVNADDLLVMACALGAAEASAYESLLVRHADLLTPRVTAALAAKAILRSRAGGLAAPETLHLPTGINLACIDDVALLVQGEQPALYRKLRCRERPDTATLLEVLARHRDAGLAPPRPDQFYPALAEALRRERSAASLANEAVLFIDGAYATPHQSLAALRPPRCLQGAVPTYRGGGVIADAYLDLGASAVPRDQHWSAFFNWVGARASGLRGQPLGKVDRVFLREAYQRRTLVGLPADVPESTLCLLAEDGSARSLADLRGRSFLENDYPELADALVAAGAGYAFADDLDTSRVFLRRLGLEPLSQVCGQPRVTIGPATPAPAWFRTEKNLADLHRTDLAQAVAELAFAHQKLVPDFEPVRAQVLRQRLRALRQIRFVQDVRRTYRMRKAVEVPAESAIVGDELVFRRPVYRFDYDQMLAHELAQLAGAKRLSDIRPLVSSILNVLQAETSAERLAYLRRIGIRPKTWASDESDEAEAGVTREEIIRELFDTLDVGPATDVGGAAPASGARIPPPLPTPPATPPPPPAPPAALNLPPLDEVVLSQSGPQGAAPPAAATAPRSPSSAWPSSGGWTPPTPAEIERDRQVGARGEEIVYRAELERVRALGFDPPEQKVIWSSHIDAGADHDIQSIDADGLPIWIEVKATSGYDGRFDWPRREFEKALREGARYQLWRVYGATSANPLAKVFSDPITLLRTSVVRLELGGLRAFVEGRTA